MPKIDEHYLAEFTHQNMLEKETHADRVITDTNMQFTSYSVRTQKSLGIHEEVMELFCQYAPKITSNDLEVGMLEIKTIEQLKSADKQLKKERQIKLIKS